MFWLKQFKTQLTITFIIIDIVSIDLSKKIKFVIIIINTITFIHLITVINIILILLKLFLVSVDQMLSAELFDCVH